MSTRALMSLANYKSYLGRVVTLHGSVGKGQKWVVRSIHAEHPDHPWGWMVRLDNPAQQCRLSLKSESFEKEKV